MLVLNVVVVLLEVENVVVVDLFVENVVVKAVIVAWRNVNLAMYLNNLLNFIPIL